MSSLWLVRHTQASFFSQHYDELSELGQMQARMLGEFWVRCRPRIDAVYVGPRQRQQQTAAIVAECYRQSGISFPEPVLLPELDEFDLPGIERQIVPAYAKQNAEFASLMEVWRSMATDNDREQHFQKAFELLMRHWLTLEGATDGVECWRAFRERVQRGIQQLVDGEGRQRRVLAFTSGGFIGTAVQCVLGAPDQTALEMSWRIRNGSVTEFVFSRGRISLDSFNGVAHFTTPELLTYR